MPVEEYCAAQPKINLVKLDQMSGSESNSEQVQVVDRLDQTTQHHQSLLNIVPDDVWSEIFQWLCQNSLAEYQKSGRESPIPLSPYTLSHVCRHWQYLAISQPNLWTNIFVFEHTKSPRSLLSTSLRRTGSLKLSVWIIAKESWRFNTPKFITCLEDLAGVSSRWISLSLALGDHATAVILEFFHKGGGLTQDNNNFSSLQRIESIIPWADRIPRVTNGYQFIHDVFRDCPTFKPSVIRLINWHPIQAHIFHLNQPNSSTPWTSVVSFVSHRYHLVWTTVLLPHLMTMPKLESLEFDNCAIPDDHSPQCRTTLNSLKKLSILNMTHAPETKTIFDHILLPNLEEVHISPTFHFRALREMVETSQCTLRRLLITIEATAVIAAELFSLLSSPVFLSLRELTVYGEVNELFVQYLGKAPPRVILQGEEDLYELVAVPATSDLRNIVGLTHLTLIGCSTPDGQLGDLAKGRILDGSLRYLYVETDAGVNEAHAKDYKAFRELQCLGFDVHMRRTSAP